MKKNKGLKPPSDPKINLSPLTPKGGVNVAFTQPMLAPKKGTTFNPKIYNSVMDIEIESINDQSTFKGAFGESKKRSLATQEESGEASKMTFVPIITDHNSTGYTVTVEFENPSEMTLGGKA